MSSVLDRIPGADSAMAFMRDAARQAHELKSRQRTTGQGGQLGYRIESTADWDYTLTLPTTPPYTAQYAEFRITFTGDGSQQFPIVQPATDIRVNGTGEANRLQLGSNGRYMYSNSGNVVQEYYLDSPDPSSFESPTTLSWIIALEYMGAVTLRMKARGAGSSPGEWSIARIA